MIRQVVDETPDIREDKIAALRDALKRGTYVVHNKEVAEKMIREFLLDTYLQSNNNNYG